MRLSEEKKFATGRTPSPARWKRALPGLLRHAFTIIELLIVMAIIIVLAGLVIATSGYVQEKSKRSRTEAEIAAMSAALESYRADNGIYPTNPDTAALNPTTDPNSASTPENNYTKASLHLYNSLSGATAGSRTPATGARAYFALKPQMLYPPPPSNDPVTCIRDPFGNSYGYSTMKANATGPAPTGGFNPTFDLWSTAGAETINDQAKWIKNW